MKDEEFRVGIFVLEYLLPHDRQRSPVKETQIDHHDLFNDQFNPEKYEGIQLTENWLTKLGFEESALTPNKWKHVRMVVCFLEGEAIFVCGGIGDPRFTYIKYVHQLQNLYFALTGDELIIP